MNYWMWLVLLLQSVTIFTQENKLKLWYNQPSGSVWENALPIGNGRQGAMIYGNVKSETIQLNEHTVWSGGPNRNDNPLALEKLTEIRDLIFKGQYKEAENLVNKAIISKSSHGQMFQPVGDLKINFKDHDSSTNYYRELDISKAIAKTRYKIRDVLYTRESFASLADNVIILKLSASKAKKLSFDLYYSSPHLSKSISTAGKNELILKGTTSDHEGVKGLIKFESIAKIKTDGGTISTKDTSITIQNATNAYIFISIATNFINYNDVTGNESAKAKTLILSSFYKPYSLLIQNHITAYQKLFNRVKLDLGDSDAALLPTDLRLKKFRNTFDPGFVTLYYQYGRYLLISSSQPGGQPANLQGIWNHRMKPAWDSKYTININTEMNYWPAEKTNLTEMHDPLLKMIKELSVTGRETAKKMYGTRGWLAHHNTDIWRVTGAVDGAFWGVWNSGGAWLCLHLWERYLYSGDKKYLQEMYPVLKEASAFYIDFLIKHPQYNWYVVSPANSPENAPKAHENSSMAAGATMDNQILFDLFNATIRSAAILNRDKAFSDSIQTLRDHLPPMHIGQHNQLQEWLDDVDDPNDHHRHVSHLFGLYPSNQISAYRTPELFAASRNTLMQRGDVSTGWSMGWKVNWWAKLQDGNHAYELIKNQLTPLGENPDGGGTYNNLFDAHPPFQIDGNFGCTSGITEMLMQSSDGAVHLLPALPDKFPSGKISGLRAIGGFEIVDMQWKESKLIKLVIKSNLGGNLRIRTPNDLKLANGIKLKEAIGKNPNSFFEVDEVPDPIISDKANIQSLPLKKTRLYDIPTNKGQIFSFVKI